MLDLFDGVDGADSGKTPESLLKEAYVKRLLEDQPVSSLEIGKVQNEQKRRATANYLAGKDISRVLLAANEAGLVLDFPLKIDGNTEEGVMVGVLLKALHDAMGHIPPDHPHWKAGLRAIERAKVAT